MLNAQIEYQLTADDLVAFRLFDQRNAPLLFPQARNTGRRRALVMWGMMVLLFAFLFLVVPLLLPSGDIKLCNSLAAAVVCIVLLPPVILLVPWLTQRLWLNRRHLAEGVRADIKSGRLGPFKPVSLEATIEGFQVACPDSDSRILWSGVQAVGQDENAIYLYTMPIQAYVVPRRAFADSAQAQEFYETALRCVDAAKKQSPTPLL
jgi:hypothetical protein